MNTVEQISFTDKNGRILFCIPNGGFLRLAYGNGDEHFAPCRYLDESHAEIDGVRHCLAEFAKKMEQNGISCAPA